MSNGYDTTTEYSLIAVALQSPDQVRDIFLAVGAEDWFDRKARDIAAVIAGMMRSGKTIDPTAVLIEAGSRGLVPGRIPPNFIIDCFGMSGVQAVSASTYAQTIKNLSAARTLNGTGERLTQRTQSSLETGVDRGDILSHIRDARRGLDIAERAVGELEFEPLMGISSFLNSVSHDHDWLVPGLLERMDRIVLTGMEGGGKTWACSQIACTLAASLHPFTGHQLGSGNYHSRVLVIDCENSPQQSARRFNTIMGKVDKLRRDKGLSPMDWDDHMSLVTRPAGIDLLAGADTAWLDRTISSFAPDLLLLGPLYKLHHENPNEEKPAREITWVIDGLRERYGFALLTEAHAGKANNSDGRRNMAPIGSSVFLRWSEFGFGLLRSPDDPGKARAEKVDVVSWRGSREERQWPSKLQYGVNLPWMPADPEYYDEVRLRVAT
ncbi:replicative DNA helicase [Nocardia amikacinitolerans]|uniref:Replicative DNA helicase n=1 Tax=Nocardia amikacinitolerans TaxID=756689 RepID=A0A285LH47_9NOCA|nr:AAA family ATPase [Nocardia amikacinitolerans]SNY84279.1 replicative DNA helicase [Nocardia amikacinitolerans]